MPEDSPRARDILYAIGLLTRLPVPVDGARAAARGARAAWAWPLAGLAVGGLSALVAGLALALGLTPGIAAGLAVSTGAVVTGGLHEDGLADSADGFWGGQDAARRLEIMRDSRIGSYGAIALVLSLGLRWTALTALLAADGGGWALLAAAVLSRAPMVSLAAHLAPARPGGLSAGVGRPGPRTEAMAWGVAVVLAVYCLGFTSLGALVICALTGLAVAGLARARLGGQTGDVLGASQQLAEIAVLMVCVGAG